MRRKKHNPGPIPPGNQPQTGFPHEQSDSDGSGKAHGSQSPGPQEEDPKRRLGDYTGTGEHARQQPGPLNDGGKRHGEDTQ
jgi:hypothetical protein